MACHPNTVEVFFIITATKPAMRSGLQLAQYVLKLLSAFISIPLSEGNIPEDQFGLQTEMSRKPRNHFALVQSVHLVFIFV